jgi:hypothetical protein
VDISLTRCLERVALAKELFEVCKTMDKWFNLGEGRSVVRGAAAASGTKLRSGTSARAGLLARQLSSVRVGHTWSDSACALGFSRAQD